MDSYLRFSLFFLLFLTSFWLCAEPVTKSTESTSSELTQVRVTFVNPASPERPFWKRLTKLMVQAAHELNIELKVIYCDNKRSPYLELLRQEIESETRPDVLVYTYHRGDGVEIFDLAERAGVKSIIINTSIPEADRARVLTPRQKFSHWIGHVYPDDVQAGYDLGKALIQLNRAKGLTHSNFVAINGHKWIGPSLDRTLGLRKAVSEDDEADLLQLVHTDWQGKNAQRITYRLLRRFPDTSAIWAASDTLAIQSSVIVNHDMAGPVFNPNIGGIDWSDEALSAIETGKLDASVGGHFMDGAWAMVLIYDYFHGYDFASEAVQFNSQMSVVTKKNIKLLQHQLSDEQLQRIQYKAFSKALNPELSQYNFSWKSVCEQLKNLETNRFTRKEAALAAQPNFS